MPFFSRVFKKYKDNDANRTKVKSKKHIEQDSPAAVVPPKPRWADAWTRKDVEPEEVQELLRGCTFELKSRGGNEMAPLSQMAAADPIRSRYTVPLAPISPSVGPQCSKIVHPELFQCRQRL